MPPEAGLSTLSDIREMVDLVELADVVTFEERARRLSPTPETAPEVRSDQEPAFSNSLAVTETPSGDSIGFRFRMVLKTSGAEFVSDVQARYLLSEPRSVTDDLKQEFAERVAFMTAYPYMRASIQGSAMRLGVPAPVLGIVKQGQLHISGTLDDEQTAREFGDDQSEL